MELRFALETVRKGNEHRTQQAGGRSKRLVWRSPGASEPCAVGELRTLVDPCRVQGSLKDVGAVRPL